MDDSLSYFADSSIFPARTHFATAHIAIKSIPCAPKSKSIGTHQSYQSNPGRLLICDKVKDMSRIKKQSTITRNAFRHILSCIYDSFTNKLEKSIPMCEKKI